MKNILYIPFLITSTLLVSGPHLSMPVAQAQPQHKQPLQKIVDKVDLQKLEGTWYELARLPNFFQPQSHIGGTDTYQLQADGKIKVTYGYYENSFQNPHKSMQATMRRADPTQNNGQFKIQFLWPFEADYWVIDLDPEYRYLVIGYPDRSMLWIMSPTPRLEPELYARALDTIKTQGYDVSKLISIPQPD